MKKFLIFILVYILTGANLLYSQDIIYSDKNKFGVKDETGNIIIEPKYTKLIRLGEEGYIARFNSRFGVIDKKGEIKVPFKYRHVERILGRWVKLGNYSDYGIYSDKGEVVLEPKYDEIELLFGGMFLTYKDYYYGVSDFNGNLILDNIFEEIYMPKPNVMRLKFNGEWYEIEQVSSDSLTLPEDILSVSENEDFKISSLVLNTGVASGYSVLTFSDYLIKIFSSISPAHEETIDELMLSRGADTVSILFKFKWLIMYPFAFARNYYTTMRNPNNGLLSNVRRKFKNKMK